MALFTRSIVCRDAVELVTDYLEGALSRRDRKRFERHLAGCPHCTEYLAQMRATAAISGRLDPEAIPADVMDGLEDVFRRWKSE